MNEGRSSAELILMESSAVDLPARDEQWLISLDANRSER